jgi:hypothetical protein
MSLPTVDPTADADRLSPSPRSHAVWNGFDPTGFSPPTSVTDFADPLVPVGLSMRLDSSISTRGVSRPRSQRGHQSASTPPLLETTDAATSRRFTIGGHRLGSDDQDPQRDGLLSILMMTLSAVTSDGSPPPQTRQVTASSLTADGDRTVSGPPHQQWSRPTRLEDSWPSYCWVGCPHLDDSLLAGVIASIPTGNLSAIWYTEWRPRATHLRWGLVPSQHGETTPS